jgi:hypothetical protein
MYSKIPFEEYQHFNRHDRTLRPAVLDVLLDRTSSDCPETTKGYVISYKSDIKISRLFDRAMATELREGMLRSQAIRETQ